MKKKLPKYLLLMLTIYLSAPFVAAQENDVDPNGFNTFYYETGEVSSEGRLKNGKPIGRWVNYYRSGVVKSEGERNGDELEGEWKFFSEEGILLESIVYTEGRKNGLTKQYSKEGFLELTIPYVDGKKQGISTAYFTNGTVQAETPFENGVENGLAYEYDDQGNIITITTYKNSIFIRQELVNRRNKAGQKVGLWKEFYEDGTVKSEGRYSNDRKDGYWKDYSAKGVLLETFKFSKGEMITDAEEISDLEVQERYYPDSDGKLSFRGTYLQGKAHGMHIWFNLDGSIDSAKVFKSGSLIAEGTLDRDGLRIGSWREYYFPEGQLRANGEYKKGYRFGEWVYYFPDGSLEQKGVYAAKGKADGLWNWFYENGQLLREETFTKGLENGWLIEYNDTGKVIKKGEYVSGREEGEWFYEIGDHLERGMYEGGYKQGVWEHTYLSNGELRYEGEYFDDLEQGEHTWYYDSGVKMLEGTYVSGVKEGEWVRYNRDGSVFVSIEYRSGIEVRVDGVKMKFQESDKQEEAN